MALIHWPDFSLFEATVLGDGAKDSGAQINALVVWRAPHRPTRFRRKGIAHGLRPRSWILSETPRSTYSKIDAAVQAIGTITPAQCSDEDDCKISASVWIGFIE